MPSPDPPVTVRKIKHGDRTATFSCGEAGLDTYLRRYARQSQDKGGPTTYVAIDSTRTVLGFYSLVSDRLEHQDAPPDLTRGMGQRPIPMTLLACLAIDEHEQRGGLGTALVLHAFNTALDAAELVGSRGILVHPINEELYRYYARFGFRRLNSVPSAEETSMYVLMKDLRATFEAFGHGEDNP